MEDGEQSKTPRILIVEDEVLIAAALEASLKSGGYDVVSAVSGEQAIVMADHHPPDLVLINIRLGGLMDGVNVAEAIRRHHDPAIIYLTADAKKDLIKRASTTEPYGYLSKPVSPEELLRAVEATLYRHTMERRLRESERRLELALESAEMGTWVWDVRSRTGKVSDRYLEMGGYTRGEVNTDYQTWQQYVHVDDWPNVTAAFFDHLKGRTPIYEAEYRLRCKSGAWKWILVRGKVIERDPQGKALRMVGTVLDVDARHSVQRRLEESRDLVRSVLSSLDAAVCVADYATREIVECNRAAEEIFGYSPDELIGSSTRLLHVDDETFRQFGEAARSALKLDRIYYSECRMRRKNGEIFPTEHYVASIPSSTGKIANVVSVTRDITQRKRDEENLARARSLLEALNEAQSQFISRTDPQEVYDGLLWNLLKLTESDSGFIAEQFFDDAGVQYCQPLATTDTTEFCRHNHIAAHRLYRTKGLVGAVVATGMPVISNDPARDHRAAGSPEGHPQVHSYLGLPLLARERLVGVIGIANRPGGYDEEIVAFLAPYVSTCANIIDAYRQEQRRRQAEEALRESEAKLRLITDALPVLISYTDTEQRYQFLNEKYEQWTGRRREDMIGRKIADVWPGENYERVREGIEGALAGKTQSFEAKAICANAPARDFNITYIPNLDEQGKVRGFAGLAADVTEQKKAEDRLKAALNEKEVLLREIHHRVKNNLAVISSLINLQAAHAIDEFHRQMFRDVQTRVRSMAIAHEKLYQSENLAKLSMQAYVRSLVDHLAASTSTIGSPVRLTKEVDDVTLGLDTAVPVGFIVTELVSNSLKHAFPSGRRGEITVAFHSLGEDEYEIVVADDGVGLAEDLNLVGLKTLGLDLVRTFVAQLNGSLLIRRDRGTEFRITFKEVQKSTGLDRLKTE